MLTIFHPTSPLHDGAVVIQKGRLAASQVFFPLSLSKDISRFFGTRHRAAIGVTEETDAIAIIVQVFIIGDSIVVWVCLALFMV